MTNDSFGNLGHEMKAMQDERTRLLAGLKDNHKRLRGATRQTLAAAAQSLGETGKANAQLAAQTRQMLAQADKDLQAQTRQTMAEADAMVTAIRKDVAALKADAGQILADANGFLSQTSADNAKLRVQTRKMLAHARTESKAQTRQTLAEAGKVMAQTKEAVAGVRMNTGRMLAEAAGVMKRLSAASHQRTTAWRDILHTLHGNGTRCCAAGLHGMPIVGKPAGKPMTRRTRAGGKRSGRKAA